MGNYVDFEQDFIMRTMMLIEQYYDEVVPNKPFYEQFNYTLLINCLFGLIVMPKERAMSAIPTTRLTIELKRQMGIQQSHLPSSETTLRDLIIKMRHSVAHCDFEVISQDADNRFDLVNFKDTESKHVFASFVASEIRPFLRFYTDVLNNNLQHINGGSA